MVGMIFGTVLPLNDVLAAIAALETRLSRYS
jgi:hypothetical protein